VTQRMKLLVAYDGTPGAEAALADLHRAGLPSALDAIVLSVVDVMLPPGFDKDPAPGLTPGMRAARAEAMRVYEGARATAERGAERLRAEFPEWTVQAEAAADSPAWALIKRADAWGADLIVIGSRGASTLERLTLGSVSQQILAEARCSVRVARQSSRRPDAPVCVVVGVDGSPGAQAALQAVAWRHWPVGSEARLVTIVDARLAVSDVAVQNLSEEAAQNLIAAGLKVSTLTTEGDPKSVLLDEAETAQADAVFVGASGLTRMSYFLLGTVASAVAARARCSVEVVRGAWT
jgi:nucleotide-binding universal stress UspA family protein